MDDKKLERVQSLEDEQLEGASGGRRILSACASEFDGDDERRDTSVFSSAARLASADNTEFGAAARCAATSDDEGLDGGIPHLPAVRPKPRI